MKPERFDIAVIGSGFGGALLATILVQQGYRVVVLDRGRHPRFAIGESSTPIADMVLESLARKYDLNELLPLTRYGTARSAYPELGIGCKRGFSYFRHEQGKPFSTDSSNSNQLLVAASASNEVSDTHWYRQDFDQFFFEMALRRGVVAYEEVDLLPPSRSARWNLEGRLASQQSIHIDTDFLIDATGNAAVVAGWMGSKRETTNLKTTSRAVFGHFESVTPWSDILAKHGTDTKEHPFRCDDAALHHVLPQGWMWQLRFDNGITSLGYVFDDCSLASNEVNKGPAFPTPDSSINERERWWDHTTRLFPSIEEQLAETNNRTPAPGLRVTGRLQFLLDKAAGDGWAALPSAVGFIDPLHSSGIAHTLIGIERLADCFGVQPKYGDASRALHAHGKATRDEIQLIDDLVSICYPARHDFRAWTTACMIYFAAATNYEHRRHEAADSEASPSFLCANDPQWRSAVNRARGAILNWSQNHPQGPNVEWLEDQVRRTIEPFNLVGLMDSSRNNMYARTAAPSKSV